MRSRSDRFTYCVYNVANVNVDVYMCVSACVRVHVCVCVQGVNCVCILLSSVPLYNSGNVCVM